MKIIVGDVVELQSGEIVEITEIRDSTFAYPIWYINIKTSIPDGCKRQDIKRKIKKEAL